MLKQEYKSKYMLKKKTKENKKGETVIIIYFPYSQKNIFAEK